MWAGFFSWQSHLKALKTCQGWLKRDAIDPLLCFLPRERKRNLEGATQSACPVCWSRGRRGHSRCWSQLHWASVSRDCWEQFCSTQPKTCLQRREQSEIDAERSGGISTGISCVWPRTVGRLLCKQAEWMCQYYSTTVYWQGLIDPRLCQVLLHMLFVTLKLLPYLCPYSIPGLFCFSTEQANFQKADRVHTAFLLCSCKPAVCCTILNSKLTSHSDHLVLSFCHGLCN